MNKKGIAVFIIISFFFLWVLDYFVFLLSQVIDFDFIIFMLAHFTGFGPLIGAFFVVYYCQRDERNIFRKRFLRFKTNPIWYFFAIAIPFFTYLVLRLVAIQMGSKTDIIELPITSFGWPLILAILLSGIKEEAGWRGYLQPELQKSFSTILSSIIVGIVWAFWHLMLYVFGTRPIEQFPQFVFTLVALSVIYTWLFIQTDSIPVVMILHIAHNFAVYLFLDLNQHITFFNGGGLVYTIIALVLVFLYGKDLNQFRYQKSTT